MFRLLLKLNTAINAMKRFILRTYYWVDGEGNNMSDGEGNRIILVNKEEV